MTQISQNPAEAAQTEETLWEKQEFFSAKVEMKTE